LSFLSLDPTVLTDPIWILTTAQVSFYLDLGRGIEGTKSTGNQRVRNIEKVEELRPCHVGQDDETRKEENVVKEIVKKKCGKRWLVVMDCLYSPIDA
jgi:hypothetical protein